MDENIYQIAEQIVQYTSESLRGLAAIGLRCVQ